MNSRVVFLDYDGVVNTPMWNEEGTHCSYGFPKQGKVNNFQAVQWVSEACQKFGYDIVVTSTWRLDDNYKECLINGGLRPGIEILGRTDVIRDACRGVEIKKYLEEHPEINYYIIIDDEADILPEQAKHFILTNGDTGFNLSEFNEFERIFMNDNSHGGSFPDRKNKDYRKEINNMKLWIDDVRPAPEGYIECKSVRMAQHWIEQIEYEAFTFDREGLELIDIDHDAGDYAKYGGDYIKLLDWLEETGRNYPIRIHSMNPVGVANMRAIIERNGWREVK